MQQKVVFINLPNTIVGFFDIILLIDIFLAIQQSAAASVIPLASEQQQSTIVQLDNNTEIPSSVDDERVTESNSRSPSPKCAISVVDVEPTMSDAPQHFVPTINQRVLNVVMQRHCKAVMHPWIYHAMTKVFVNC
jgi:hypothetical protein